MVEAHQSKWLVVGQNFGSLCQNYGVGGCWWGDLAENHKGLWV